MTEIQVRPKADKCIAWQYDGFKLPIWVKNNTCYNDLRELVVDRRSGPQKVDVGDWLIKELDGGITWCPDRDMWKEWEKVQ